MNSNEFIFGLRDLPRPRGYGFLFYKKSIGMRKAHLIDLNLYGESDGAIREKFRRGLANFISRENISTEESIRLLNHCRIENMEDWMFSCVL